MEEDEEEGHDRHPPPLPSQHRHGQGGGRDMWQEWSRWHGQESRGQGRVAKATVERSTSRVRVGT